MGIVRHTVELVTLGARVRVTIRGRGSIEYVADRDGELRVASIDLLSPSAEDLSIGEIAGAHKAANEYWRGVPLRVELPLIGTARELGMLETQYPDAVRLVLATRNRAVISIRGTEREFKEQEGRLVLVPSDDRRLPDGQYRLAMAKAREAIDAVREGHRRAAQVRAKAKAEETGKQVVFPL